MRRGPAVIVGSHVRKYLSPREFTAAARDFVAWARARNLEATAEEQRARGQLFGLDAIVESGVRPGFAYAPTIELALATFVEPVVLRRDALSERGAGTSDGSTSGEGVVHALRRIMPVRQSLTTIRIEIAVVALRFVPLTPLVIVEDIAAEVVRAARTAIASERAYR